MLAVSTGAQTKPADAALLSVDRIFASRDFAAERFGPARWMADGDSYTTVEPGAGGAGRDLVLYSAETGSARDPRAGQQLVPPGATTPIAIEDYAWSPDGKVLIVFTNSRRVWRQNTRGDFWTYDLASGRAPPARSGLRAVDADVRQALARRPHGRLRRQEQHLRRGPGRRCDSPADRPTAPTTSSTARRTGSTKRSSASATASAGAPTAAASPSGSSIHTACRCSR